MASRARAVATTSAAVAVSLCAVFLVIDNAGRASTWFVVIAAALLVFSSIADWISQSTN